MNNKYNSIEDKLTDAANDALEELLSDIKHQLLTNAQKFAFTKAGEVHEITVRDIFRSYELLGMRREEEHTEQYKVISFGFLGIGFIAAILSAYSAFGKLLYDDWILSYSLSIFILAIGLIYFLLYRKLILKARREWVGENNTKPGDYSMILVSKWRELELAIRLYIALIWGESQADIPISKSIRLLSEKKIISQVDEKSLLDALRIRNEALHTGAKLSRLEALQIEGVLEDIRKKIEK